MNQEQISNQESGKESSMPATSLVPTIRVLAIGTNKEKAISSNEMIDIMHREVPATVNLYLNGKIDSWFSKIDQTGVVFIMNVSSVSEAHELLTALPLGQLGMMEFELIPLGPLNPLRSLLS